MLVHYQVGCTPNIIVLLLTPTFPLYSRHVHTLAIIRLVAIHNYYYSTSANMASFEVEMLLKDVSLGSVVNLVFGHNPIGELISENERMLTCMFTPP